MSMLEVKNLKVEFKTPDGVLTAVNNSSFSVEPGHTLGIVGESGSGKSQTMMAIMGLLAKNARVTGSIKLAGKELVGCSKQELRDIRGNHISIIFQDPMTSLNPYLTIEKQMCEVLREHKKVSYRQAQKTALEMLDAVKISAGKKRIKMYPHEFSGGMRQRIVIAMALLCQPEVLLADEPTTALDVTVQAQIMQLLDELQAEFNTAIVLNSHDLGVVAGNCEQVMVMYAGNMMEYGNISTIFANPSHPYTQGLLSSLPKLDEKVEKLATIPGNPPHLLHLPYGCTFQDRCQYAKATCQLSRPQLQNLTPDHAAACFRLEEGRYA